MELALFKGCSEMLKQCHLTTLFHDICLGIFHVTCHGMHAMRGEKGMTLRYLLCWPISALSNMSSSTYRDTSAIIALGFSRIQGVPKKVLVFFSNAHNFFVKSGIL